MVRPRTNRADGDRPHANPFAAVGSITMRCGGFGKPASLFTIELHGPAAYIAAMSAATSSPLLESLAESVAGCLDAPSLQAMANLQLDAATRQRLDELADKANEGQVTPEERAEYQSFISISEFLGLAQLRARARLGLPLAS